MPSSVDETDPQKKPDPGVDPEYLDIEEYLSTWSLPLIDDEQQTATGVSDEGDAIDHNRADHNNLLQQFADLYPPLTTDILQEVHDDSENLFQDANILPDVSYGHVIPLWEQLETSSISNSHQNAAFNQHTFPSSLPAVGEFSRSEGNSEYIQLSSEDTHVPKHLASFLFQRHISEQSGLHKTLPRRRSKYMLHRTPTSTTATPIPIPLSTSRSLSDVSNPLQRWRNSPPEEEGASMTAISRALSDLEAAGPNHGRPTSSTSSRNEHLKNRRKARRPQSITSSQGSRGSSSSRQSGTSIPSNHSLPVETAGSRTPHRARERPRNKGKDAEKESRIFKCTFCCDTFKRKYDWTRHEKSLHLDLEGWRCTPYGGIITPPTTSRTVCAYCNMLDPSIQHLEAHNHLACHGEGVKMKTFGRKDHLVQHLRLVHRLETLPLIDDWKVEPPIVRSRCGFCDLRMNSWEERQDHLAFHFRLGITMDSWVGEHDFDAEIQAQVKHAIPPYLLAGELKTLVPFSVTNVDALDCMEQIISGYETADALLQGSPADILENTIPNTTLEPVSNEKRVYTELLTSYLAKFAQEQVRNGIVPTDEMFQNESRKLMYLSEDPWNQTAADNPRWLANFRQSHNVNQVNNS